MNLNIIGYIIYLAITSIVIIKARRICYQNGNFFVSELLPNHEDLCHKINQILLVGYYLLNLGYCAMTLISWKKVLSFQQLIEVIALKSGIIICVIATMYYINIIVVTNNIKKIT